MAPSTFSGRYAMLKEGLKVRASVTTGVTKERVKQAKSYLATNHLV